VPIADGGSIARDIVRRMDAPYRHIACCIDRSAASKGVLVEAIRLRGVGPGRLSILHASDLGILFAAYPGVVAIDPEPIRGDSKRWLDEVVGGTPGSEAVLLDGYPAAAACEWAAREGVDLLVASSSRGLVERVLLGSFAGYLTHHAPCSVLLTRPVVEAPAVS
jgi:nucleotide-binding universal stress UspA family protein